MLFHWGDINHLGTLNFPVVENIQLMVWSFYKDFEYFDFCILRNTVDSDDF